MSSLNCNRVAWLHINDAMLADALAATLKRNFGQVVRNFQEQGRGEADGESPLLELFVCEIPAESPAEWDLFEATEESLDAALEMHVAGPFFAMQEAAQLLGGKVEGSRRTMVLVAPAPVPTGPPPTRDASCASVASEMLTKLWALRLAEEGVDVYEVRPAAGAQISHQAIADAVAALAEGTLSYGSGNVLTVQ
ncbi:MAG: hypothetical protein KDA61_04110 [Planctomycetales bacterium]|nr:hypothetical protein [Planctomycetales bacterium]